MPVPLYESYSHFPLFYTSLFVSWQSGYFVLGNHHSCLLASLNLLA